MHRLQARCSSALTAHKSTAALVPSVVMLLRHIKGWAKRSCTRWTSAKLVSANAWLLRSLKIFVDASSYLNIAKKIVTSKQWSAMRFWLSAKLTSTQQLLKEKSIPCLTPGARNWSEKSAQQVALRHKSIAGGLEQASPCDRTQSSSTLLRS